MFCWWFKLIFIGSNPITFNQDVAFWPFQFQTLWASGFTKIRKTYFDEHFITFQLISTDSWNSHGHLRLQASEMSLSAERARREHFPEKERPNTKFRSADNLSTITNSCVHACMLKKERTLKGIANIYPRTPWFIVLITIDHNAPTSP